MPPSPMMRDWARHLLAHESASSTDSVQTEPAESLVYGKLRERLLAPIGIGGFQALASRALMLARLEVPGLSAVRIMPDGCLHGLNDLEAQWEPDQRAETAVILIAHLLELFLVFLGAATMRQLVQDAFPQFEVPTDTSTTRPFEGILQEVNNLRSVCETLESLAQEHPAMGAGLTSISENIRNIATILDVFAIVRNASDTLLEAEPYHTSTDYLM